MPEDKDGDKTPQYQLKSTVTKIERGREPNVNDKKVKKSKRREETVTRVRSRSPSPIGDDPQIEVSEGPTFSLPTKEMETDEDHVPSLQSLTAKARTKAASNAVCEENPVAVQVSLPAVIDETTISVEVLQSILNNMTELYTPAEPGQSVTDYSTNQPLQIY